jgi:hypothetical protein
VRQSCTHRAAADGHKLLSTCWRPGTPAQGAARAPVRMCYEHAAFQFARLPVKACSWFASAARLTAETRKDMLQRSNNSNPDARQKLSGIM